MSERPPSQPKQTQATVAGKTARAERVAAEMRRNLMKRKRQQREKTGDAETENPDQDISDSRS